MGNSLVCLNANYQVTVPYSWNDNVQAVIKHPGKTDLLLEPILLNLAIFPRLEGYLTLLSDHMSSSLVLLLPCT